MKQLYTTTDINWGHQGGKKGTWRAEGRKGGQEGRRGGQEGRSTLLFLPSWNTAVGIMSVPSMALIK